MNYVWSDDPKTEFLTSMLVLFLMYIVLPATFIYFVHYYSQWRDKKK